MRIGRRTAPAFAASSLLTALGFSACTCDSSGVGKLHSVIEVAPRSVDLGDVPLGVRATASIGIRSTGSAMLSISSARLEGSPIFTMASPAPRFLPPAASSSVSVDARPVVLGPATADLVIDSDDAELPTIHVTLKVNGVPQPPCDDGNPCTADAFDTAASACTHAFTDGAPCTAADKCVIDAVCAEGVCLGHPKVCDDHSACTQDYCRQNTGECVFLPTEDACDDHNPCTADSCVGNDCVHEPVLAGTPCDDGDLCTVGDACFAGVCRGSGIADGSPCDDHDSCTVGDTCHAGVCRGDSVIERAREGDEVFTYNLVTWPGAFLHRREVSLSDDGVFYGLDHLPVPDAGGLTHVVFAMKQCGSENFVFSYRPPDTHVLVRYVRREMQLTPDDVARIVVGVRQLPEDGFEPQTTTYLLDRDGNVKLSQIQVRGGETGRSLLPDGSHIFGQIWPLTEGPPTETTPSEQNLVIVREDALGNVLWRNERSSLEWAEFLGVAGPRVLFWSSGHFGALDFNTGNTVWTAETQHITKEMALSTNLNLGVARATTQLIGVEILQGRQVFMFPPTEDLTYTPRTDPVISADGRILVMMERDSTDPTSGVTQHLGLDWVELSPDGTVLHTTSLPYTFPEDFSMTRWEDDPYPTVADDGVTYVGYGSQFWAIDPGGAVRWTLTSTVPNAFTGTVPLLRDDGVVLINWGHRMIKGIRTNGGRMSPTGWASFRHDRRRTNFTP